MTNNINSYGANLLVRNFEYIKENLGTEMLFYSNEKENKNLKIVFFIVSIISNYLLLMIIKLMKW